MSLEVKGLLVMPAYTPPSKRNTAPPPQRPQRDHYDLIATLISVASLVALCVTTALTQLDQSKSARDTAAAIEAIASLGNETRRQANELAQQIAEMKRQTIVQRQYADAVTRQIIQLKRQSNASERTALALQGQLSELRDEQRPVVGIIDRIASGALVFDPRSAHFSLSVSVHNGGRTIASNVNLRVEFYTRTDNSAVQRQEQVCARPQLNPAGGKEQGFTVFPNANYTMSATLTMSTSDLAIWKNYLVFGNRPDREPMVVGCVVYTFGKRHFQTGFIYEVDRKGADPISFEFIDPAKGTVAANEIVLAEPPWFVPKTD